MKTISFKNAVLTVLVLAGTLIAVTAGAQDGKDKKQKQEEIIIKKKGDKDGKMTIVVDGDKITVNGEPLAEFNDDNIIIRKRELFGPDGGWANGSRSLRTPRAPLPPNPPRVWGFQGEGAGTVTSPKAMLGVYTEKDEKGARISQVVDNSPAEKAGLAKGDIITKAGDKNITDPSSLSDAIGDLKPGDEIELQYLRNNKRKKAKVILGERKSQVGTFNFTAPSFDEDMMRSFEFHGPQDWQEGKGLFYSRPQLGIRIQDTEEGNGVKVLDVTDASVAEKAGIKKDDIITAIDGTAIKSAEEAKKKIAELKDKSSYGVTVLRDNQTVQVEVKIPKKLKTADL